jgi:hypothetical protein
MSPPISPNLSSIVDASDKKRSGGPTPAVEMIKIQWVAGNSKGLLAADLLQN